MTQTMTPDKLQEFITQGESETVEFKTAIRNPSTLSQNLSAFANTAGGTLLVGIQEPDIVVGADEHQIVHLLERTKKQLSSPIDVQVQTIIVESQPVVALTVAPSKEIVFSNGQALCRVGAMVQALTPAQISSKLTTTPTPADLQALADAITKQTKTIQKLGDDLREASSFKSKMKDWLIGGAIGAVIGFFLSLLLLI